MQNLTKCVLSLAAMMLMAMPFAPVRAADTEIDAAAKPVQTFYAALTDAMKHGKELGLAGRGRQIAPVIEESFDLPAMMQLSVGPSWSTISGPDRKALIDAFERMTVANYAKNFSAFNGEQFVIDPMVKTRNEDRIVETKLVKADHSSVAFNYRMHLVGGKWKIVDIYLDGSISQLALKRSDFSSTVATSGASGLIKKLNDLVDKQMAGG